MRTEDQLKKKKKTTSVDDIFFFFSGIVRVLTYRRKTTYVVGSCLEG